MEYFKKTGNETEEELTLLNLAEKHIQAILEEQKEKEQIAKLNNFLK